jgi:pimeloyl-ACP methyl ester carboxylesterase
MVRRSVRELSAVLLAACAWSLAAMPSAQAEIAFSPCADSNNFACGHLTVPLDPGGGTPGTLTLALRRHRAPVGEAHSAIVALAGGPGQAALPYAEQFSEVLGAIAATRDLIVFDQRGIGLSHQLSCHALERPGLFHSIGPLLEACGAQLGPTRAFYTTADTVADIEAIRRAGGYEKLVLYGTSYGTKVAERYAQTYPDHVEALVLDSVVPPNGPDPLGRPTFAAVPRILHQLCAVHACAHITAEPVANLARVVRGMHRAPLRGRVIDGRGIGHTLRMSSDDLVELLLAGDLSPLLRSAFVTAVTAAADADTAPLARLLATAARGPEGEGQGFDTPLYFATTCEEVEFPWSRAASPRERIVQATAAARALPAAALAPFSAANALDASEVRACAHWPFSTPAPALDEAPLPNVPALILSGEADLRTPTSNAREVAGQIPDARLLVVPQTAHSVLTTEAGACAKTALQALFAGRPVEPCHATPPPPLLRPPPLPPVHLALVRPTRGYRGLPGRTLHAVTLTLGDFARQLLLALGSLGASSEAAFALPELRSGGLRAGWAQVAKGALVFHGYAYVPGVTLSGEIKAEEADLQIGGSAAAHGTLRLGAHNALVGMLGGRHVRVTPSASGSAAIVGIDAQASSNFASGRSAARAAARELARLIGRFLAS